MKIIECPRDAMQGLAKYIPVDIKRSYLEALLQVGFDTLDCGSFVSLFYPYLGLMRMQSTSVK